MIVVALLFGKLFQRLGQPAVIGEVIAGICLGPSVLGGFSAKLFPLEGRPLLKLLSTLGVVTFMFLIGLDLRLGHLKRSLKKVAAVVAFMGTIVPFGLGLLLAFALYPGHKHVQFLAFAVFMGAAMSITAFPVLARIMIEKDMYSKPLGVLTMACAAGDDVLTWATVAFVLAVMSSGSGWETPYICAAGGLFTFLMVKVVRPRLERFAERSLDPAALSLVVAALLLSAFATAAIGLHEIFGAFLAGAVFPRGRLAVQVRERVGAVALILLPVFFVVTGLNVHVGGLGEKGAWQLGLILLVACSGKVLGGFLGARAYGVKMRESLALGVLMNTRGLTELIVLNIGLQAGVIDTSLFTLLVLMAVLTTVATGPLLGLIRPDPYLGEMDGVETGVPVGVEEES